MKKILVLSLVLIMTAIIGFACSGDAATLTTPPTSTSPAPTATSPAMEPTATSPVMEPTATEPAMGGEGDAAAGQALVNANGCLGCHTIDGGEIIAPTWQGLYGSTETLEGGATITVDDAYIEESISDPNAKVVQGFSAIMQPFDFSDSEIRDIIAYIKSLT